MSGMDSFISIGREGRIVRSIAERSYKYFNLLPLTPFTVMLDSAGIAIATVHPILIIVDIIGNCLVCAIIKKHRDMRTPMNYLLVNLAVADTLYATFMAPDVLLPLTATHPGGMTGTVLCKLLTGGNLAWVGAASSIVTLVAIAIERYYAVVYPLGNKWELTKRKLKVIILGSWIFAFLYIVPGFMAKDVKENACIWPKGWLLKTSHWMWFVLIVLSLALMVGFYSRVVYTLWFKRNDDNQLNHQQRGVLRVRKRVTMMAVTVTSLFGACWITDTVTHSVDNNTSYTIDEYVYTVLHTMIFFNSASNPFVYALINQNFREKIKGMMCCARSTAVIHPAAQKTNSTEAAQLTQPTHTPGPCPK